MQIGPSCKALSHISDGSSSGSRNSTNASGPILYTTPTHGDKAARAASTLLSRPGLEQHCTELLTPSQHGSLQEDAANSRRQVCWHYKQRQFNGASEGIFGSAGHQSASGSLVGAMQGMLQQSGGFLVSASALTGSHRLQDFLEAVHKVRKEGCLVLLIIAWKPQTGRQDA